MKISDLLQALDSDTAIVISDISETLYKGKASDVPEDCKGYTIFALYIEDEFDSTYEDPEDKQSYLSIQIH